MRQRLFTLEHTMEQGTHRTARTLRRLLSRRVRRAPVRRNVDEPIFADEEREIVIGGGDKPEAGA